ncbi:pyridine nucleotide-disulfide oxidoreductase [Methyloceanibacter marginalis]|uniref:Pyridine nucleotide-disulfide oxidoreductase n=1 Tax=Methyloceanibacter marginalis TaxID=1774971 RepID=A0A1E3W9Y4_9HYPH|nr:FAD-dependent oxidoreductase [Methyloceanibacter marginalis]ODS02609.1 pyridine nucleotide-disulfide oxidoreductase [Methyloceanibacter marginalis]
MVQEEKKLTGPDLTQGIALDELADVGMIVGHVGDEEVLLVRQGNEVFAVGAQCTHYQGPLAEGLLVGDTVRCPWHHAGFDLRTGEALRAPALSPIACWKVEQRDGKITVREKRERPASKPRTKTASEPEKIVIIGGGASGFAAAEMLRRQGYQNSIILLSSDDALPYDRPNLSKDYLAGTIPFEYVPLKEQSFYADNSIDTRIGQPAVQVDIRAREVSVASGDKIPYDRLLLATGAEPVRLTIPGADQPHVHALRSLADCQAIIERTKVARRVVVIGASFIGLEVAAALRTRKLEVHVVAPDKRPMEHILGPEMGDFVRSLHEEHGVVFHFEDKVATIHENAVRLEKGGTIEADLVVVGIGVRPRLELAENSGLKLDRGVAVSPTLETSAPGVYAAGDIARWPDPHSGDNIRVEHWVVAQRQGQVAALNMLGHDIPFTAVPFFWSQHYDVPINYVGHAEVWDEIVTDGNVMSKDCILRFKRNGRVRAVASIFRDVESLEAEALMEHSTAA